MGVRKLTISRGSFLGVYELNQNVLTYEEQEGKALSFTPGQLILFNSPGSGQNFLVFIEQVSLLPCFDPSAGEAGEVVTGAGYYLLHLGEPLRDVKLWSEISEEEVESAHLTKVTYYKHLNGRGRWVEGYDGIINMPAMIMEPRLIDGQLLMAPGLATTDLLNYERRPGSMYLKEEETGVDYSLHTVPGQYMNFWNPDTDKIKPLHAKK